MQKILEIFLNGKFAVPDQYWVNEKNKIKNCNQSKSILLKIKISFNQIGIEMACSPTQITAGMYTGINVLP